MTTQVVSSSNSNENELGQLLQQPAYGLKYESTQKGYRIHVSVHCATEAEARQSALNLLLQAMDDLRTYKIPIAGDVFTQ